MKERLAHQYRSRKHHANPYFGRRSREAIPKDPGLFLTGTFNKDLNRLLDDAIRHEAEYLYISGYGIKTIPEQLFQVHSLKFLNLFEQHIDRLPEPLFNLTGLEKLIIWTTNMHNLPSAVKQLKQLKHLTIYCGCYHESPKDGKIIKEGGGLLQSTAGRDR